MKKLLVVAVVCTFVFSSCTKDYLCECTYTNGGFTYSSSTTVTGTKKEAKADCDEYAASGGATYSCSIN